MNDYTDNDKFESQKEYFTTSANPPTTLTMKDIQKAMDLVCPILYYGTDSNVELGWVYIAKESEFNPEFIVCHPNDLETLRKNLYWRRFVHIKDENPNNRIMERNKKNIERKIDLNWYLTNKENSV